jgi:hypothetical protein
MGAVAGNQIQDQRLADPMARDRFAQEATAPGVLRSNPAGWRGPQPGLSPQEQEAISRKKIEEKMAAEALARPANSFTRQNTVEQRNPVQRRFGQEGSHFDMAKAEQFRLGERVQCRDRGEAWRTGTVVSIDPLKVKPEEWDFATSWDEVQKKVSSLAELEADVRRAEERYRMERRQQFNDKQTRAAKHKLSEAIAMLEVAKRADPEGYAMSRNRAATPRRAAFDSADAGRNRWAGATMEELEVIVQRAEDRYREERRRLFNTDETKVAKQELSEALALLEQRKMASADYTMPRNDAMASRDYDMGAPARALGAPARALGAPARARDEGFAGYSREQIDAATLPELEVMVERAENMYRIERRKPFNNDRVRQAKQDLSEALFQLEAARKVDMPGGFANTYNQPADMSGGFENAYNQPTDMSGGFADSYNQPADMSGGFARTHNQPTDRSGGFANTYNEPSRMPV